MREQELLGRLAAGLLEAGLPYMLTGSFASSLQGYPRGIGNLDVLAPLAAGEVRRLKMAFPAPGFELDEPAALRALERGESFALVDGEGGGQADFWPLSGSAFDRSRFARRREERFQGLLLPVSSPEDTILSKLYWGARWGQAGKQAEDALGVYELQYSRLDATYLRRWAAELGVAAELERLEKGAHPAG